MTLELKFNFQDVVHYFGRTPASEIYKAFYPPLHTPRYTDGREEINYPLIVLKGKLRTQIEHLVNKIQSGSSSSLRDDLDSRAVGTHSYEQALARIVPIVGDKAEPYLKEYTLLAEYERTSDVNLMIVNALSTTNMPRAIKEKLHQDEYILKDEDFNAFIHWLEEHPENNNFRMNQQLIDGSTRLYQRIEALSTFYKSGRAVPFEDLIHRRKSFINNLNVTILS